MEKWQQESGKTAKNIACFSMRSLVPRTWTAVERHETTLGFQDSMTWQPDVYFSDVRRRPLAGPQIETSGLGHCLPEAGRRAEGSLPRPRKANCASSRARGTCGAGGEHQHIKEIRVDAQSTSSHPVQSRRGDLCDSKPQRVVRVTRRWRSHLTAKELDIGCSTRFDMRDNTFADEMAGRAATRVEVPPSQANAVQAIDGVVWQVRMRIIEANLAAFSAQPKREFLPPRTPAHRKTRQQKSNKLPETLASVGT